MIKYTIKATRILPDGTSKPIEVVIKSYHPETHAMLKGKVWDMVDTGYVSLYIDKVEESDVLRLVEDLDIEDHTIPEHVAPFDLVGVKEGISSGFRVVPNGLSDDELDAWLCGGEVEEEMVDDTSYD